MVKISAELLVIDHFQLGIKILNGKKMEEERRNTGPSAISGKQIWQIQMFFPVKTQKWNMKNTFMAIMEK